MKEKVVETQHEGHKGNVAKEIGKPEDDEKIKKKTDVEKDGKEGK